jgi:hypothetical protein
MWYKGREIASKETEMEIRILFLTFSGLHPLPLFRGGGKPLTTVVSSDLILHSASLCSPSLWYGVKVKVKNSWKWSVAEVTGRGTVCTRSDLKVVSITLSSSKPGKSFW